MLNDSDQENLNQETVTLLVVNNGTTIDDEFNYTEISDPTCLRKLFINFLLYVKIILNAIFIFS